MAYPSSLDSFSTKTDAVSDVIAADYNGHSASIVAIETELGTTPKGSFADVKTRLNRYDTIGADIYRASTSVHAPDTASNTRTLTGYDTTRQADTGFTVSLGSGTITVPGTGIYVVNAHVRFSAVYTAGQVLLTINDGTNDLIRGDAAESNVGGYVDINLSGICFVTSGTPALRVTLFTTTSASTVGDATGAKYYFRIARL